MENRMRESPEEIARKIELGKRLKREVSVEAANATTDAEWIAAVLRFSEKCTQAGLVETLRPDENPRDAERLYWAMRP
jgi:hypothetical protein